MMLIIETIELKISKDKSSIRYQPKGIHESQKILKQYKNGSFTIWVIS
jgi:hypothetical protein